MAAQALSEVQMADSFPGASPNARFLAGTLAKSDESWKSYLLKSGWSVVLHVLGLGLFLYAITRPGAMDTIKKVINTPDITWIAQPGPGGGGGGGGNKMPEPPRKAEITPPKPPKMEAPPKPPVEPPKIPQANIPAVTAVTELPGAAISTPDATIAQGPSTGGGGGTGTGSGVGPGTGSGYGEGYGGGFGGGAYREGNGVSSPVLIHETKPNYTGEAMRARIQGLVKLEAIVGPDGTVGDVRVVHSLDQQFGLDKEAVRTLRQWRFKPGMRLGQPVPVLILVEISFTLR
jgi:periplasmic protein TonB